jgi:hypothetical protein
MAIALLSNKLPEDIVDDIAINVHRSAFEDVKTELTNYHNTSPFDTLENGCDPITELRKKFPNLKLHLDIHWMDWYTVVIELTPKYFILWHHYSDTNTKCRMLIEGHIDINKIKIKRYFIDTTFTRYENGEPRYISHSIPFRFLRKNVYPTLDNYEYMFDDNYNSGLKWKDPEYIWQIFHDTDWNVHSSSKKTIIDILLWCFVILNIIDKKHYTLENRCKVLNAFFWFFFFSVFLCSFTLCYCFLRFFGY